MSYDASLGDPPVKVEKHQEGGNIAIGGSVTANMSITYNYSAYFYNNIPGGLRILNEKFARDAIPLLEYAVKKLGTEQEGDYWTACKGNAGYALSILLKWAKLYPDEKFYIT